MAQLRRDQVQHIYRQARRPVHWLGRGRRLQREAGVDDNSQVEGHGGAMSSALQLGPLHAPERAWLARSAAPLLQLRTAIAVHGICADRQRKAH